MADIIGIDNARNAIMAAATSGIRPELFAIQPQLELNQRGNVVNSYDNLVMAVSCFDIGYDSFLECPMIQKDGKWVRFDDQDYVDIAIQLERIGFSGVAMPKVKESVRKVMFEKRFDSAQDWLESIVWDGTDRCTHLFHWFFGAEKNDYEQAVSQYFVSAMAARVIEPGAQCDMVPILMGKQGAGKTSAVKALAPMVDSFTEIDLSSRRDNDLARQLRGKLIGELGELRGLKSREAEWIKAWITRTHEEWTPKFVEMSKIMPRRCNFVGTTNEDEFLVDQTGNRRWLPIKVGECRIELLKKHIDQIWAQGAVMFNANGVMWQEARQKAESVHDQFMVYDDYMVDSVRETLKMAKYIGVEYIRLMDLSRDMFGDKVLSRADQHRIADALRSLGYDRKDKRINGKVLKVFVEQQQNE